MLLKHNAIFVQLSKVCEAAIIIHKKKCDNN